MHMFELEVGGRVLAAVIVLVFAYLVVRWWEFRARGPRL